MPRPVGVSTFLLEIGTEELPADFARLALPQLEQLVRRDLTDARLRHGQIACTSTPRRLVVQVDDLAATAEDLEDDRKGPPAAQAFKEGSPTPAAVGFARRCGIEPEALEVRETPKGPFVFVPRWICSLRSFPSGSPLCRGAASCAGVMATAASRGPSAGWWLCLMPR